MTPEQRVEIDRVVILADGAAGPDPASVADAVAAELRGPLTGAVADPASVGADVGRAVAAALGGRGTR